MVAGSMDAVRDARRREIGGRDAIEAGAEHVEADPRTRWIDAQRTDGRGASRE